MGTGSARLKLGRGVSAFRGAGKGPLRGKAAKDNAPHGNGGGFLHSLRQKLRWLDPFTYVDDFIMPVVKNLPRQGQWALFGFTFIALLFAIFNFFGGTIFVAGLLAIVYAYWLAFERENAVEWGIYAFSAFVFALVLYHFVLVGILGTNFPLMIVYSGSMEPTLYRGDIVLLGSPAGIKVAEAYVDFPVAGKPLREYSDIEISPDEKYGLRQSGISISGKAYPFDSRGPIVVYYSALQKKEIIHRAVLKLVAPDGNFLITFGDNNTRIDADCPQGPTPGQCINYWPVPSKDLRGKYLFHLPFLGYAKLVIFDDLPKILQGK
ncbi:Uncharacterised protein [uncultured archaeon]|nr:Uncharacterised protein [uncultured archaeon]